MTADLDSIKEYFDNKFAALAKKNLETSRSRSVLLKHKGNQSQANQQLEVLNLIELAESELETDLDSAKENLSKAKKVIEARIKLIKLADKSDNGWSTANEYVTDDLAENSDDDKKIRRAEARAEQKRKKSHGGENKRFKGDFPSTPRPPSSSGSFFRNNRPSSKRGSCFGCGKLGHWRKECRSSQVPSTSSATKTEFGKFFS